MDKTLFLQDLTRLEVKNKDVQTLYNEISCLAMKCGLKATQKPATKNAYYLSMEFLIAVCMCVYHAHAWYPQRSKGVIKIGWS